MFFITGNTTIIADPLHLYEYKTWSYIFFYKYAERLILAYSFIWSAKVEYFALILNTYLQNRISGLK